MLNRMIAVTCVLALAAGVRDAPRRFSVEKSVDAHARRCPSSLLNPLAWLAPTIPRRRKQHRKDSLWNGVIIGAGLGALVGTLVSFAVSDCSECSGFNVPLTFGVLGAGAGAGIGAGIDAWHQKCTDHRRGRAVEQPHRCLTQGPAGDAREDPLLMSGRAART